MSALQNADAVAPRRSQHKIVTPPGIPHADPWLAECLARGKTERFRVTVDLNPVTGQALLDINTHNRNEKPAKQAEWANLMKEGRWRLTHQGLAVSREGVLLDGQNRLKAVIASGCAIRIHIEFGCEPPAPVAQTASASEAAEVMTPRTFDAVAHQGAPDDDRS